MKNNTKVRLHLSKQLFESLTKEIIKEAKANDGYTVAVKQPKQPKQSKSQATSPAVQKTDAETKMEAAPTGATSGTTATTGTLAKDFRQKAQSVTKTPGISSKEVAGLQKLLNTILAKAPGGELAVAIDKAQKALDISSQNIKTGEQKPSTSPVVGQKAPMQMPKAPGGMKEMEMNVAEEGQLDEFTGTETESSGAIAMIAAALGMGVPLAAALIKDLMRAKSPEEKKQIIQKKLADKSAGMDKGTDALKEYENDDYRVVNGQCRRYNDEHEYTVVSMSYCR